MGGRYSFTDIQDVSDAGFEMTPDGFSLNLSTSTGTPFDTACGDITAAYAIFVSQLSDKDIEAVGSYLKMLLHVASGSADVFTIENKFGVSVRNWFEACFPNTIPVDGGEQDRPFIFSKR